MNKLQLCQRLRQECGISGTGPASTVGQTGELAEVVSWIEYAYHDIQALHTSWRFRVNDYTATLTPSTYTYAPTDLSITDLLVWKKHDVRVYLTQADEAEIGYVPWESFKQSYLIGTITEGRPSVFSIKPNNSIVLWQSPNDAFTLVGEYVKSVDSLSTDLSVPIFPVDYHMAIVWRALVLYGNFLAAPEKVTQGDREYTRLMRSMEQTQLEQIAWGAPLA